MNATEDHEGIVHLGEPVILVVVPIASAPLLGVIVGEPELGVVTPEHGALFEGMLHWALMVRAWLLKHVVEEPGAPSGASGILAIHDCDKIGLEGLLLPLAPLFLFLGETGGRGPGGLVPPLPLCVVLGEDGPDSLFARGEVGGDVEERGH